MSHGRPIARWRPGTEQHVHDLAAEWLRCRIRQFEAHAAPGQGWPIGSVSGERYEHVGDGPNLGELRSDIAIESLSQQAAHRMQSKQPVGGAGPVFPLVVLQHDQTHGTVGPVRLSKEVERGLRMPTDERFRFRGQMMMMGLVEQPLRQQDIAQEHSMCQLLEHAIR